MCLLVTQPEGTVFDDAFLQGVYTRNKDGLGVMRATDGKLHVAKCLPRNFKDFAKFYNKEIKGRHCAWHARMQTHGDVDHTNCHPYEVFSTSEGYPLYLMHNGVLHTSNPWDVKRSDTWHYIQRYLRTLLKSDPTLFMNPLFIELIEDHIGEGNKFALLDGFGNLVTINEDAFVEHNGAKLSNTYAWDVTGTEFDYHRGAPYHFAPSSLRSGWPYDDFDDFNDTNNNFKSLKSFKPSVSSPGSDAAVSESYDEASDLLFESLDAVRYLRAYRTLTFTAVDKYMDVCGVDGLNALSDLILEDAVTEDEVLNEIKKPGSVLAWDKTASTENIEGEEYGFAINE